MPTYATYSYGFKFKKSELVNFLSRNLTRIGLTVLKNTRQGRELVDVLIHGNILRDFTPAKEVWVLVTAENKWIERKKRIREKHGGNIEIETVTNEWEAKELIRKMKHKQKYLYLTQ